MVRWPQSSRADLDKDCCLPRVESPMRTASMYRYWLTSHCESFLTAHEHTLLLHSKTKQARWLGEERIGVGTFSLQAPP